MFFKRKEEIKILQKSLESIEKSQYNTELMVRAFCNMVDTKKEESVENNENMSDEEKRRAAYALNLCTVSVSQIIDYNDENILEQEYETILNNLNLENMPKDEALLNILKQILDTVTFFRIQEGDKVFIDKEYQQKVKNAIWAGVPNIGLFVSGANPFSVGLSLASQVGIGYMNYRKTKAENELQYEKQKWQLQRAAIEQLNALRRELFDASWRLADRYGFKDEYRLTERQITQYNKILMDADDYRRYERLESISQYFVAYPSFWYHFGHAANCIAQNAIKSGDHEIYEKYRGLAINHFERFINSDKYSLLREDQITSSCALEYIDLLDVNFDKNKIKELLDRAMKMSGQACDILQICCLSYLRIGDLNAAISILKYLVNENYNAVTNAQLLSSIYVSAIVEMGNQTLVADYKILAKKIYEELLFPLPENNESLEVLKNSFILKQREILYHRYAYVIRNYYEKCSVMFNKCIPAPDEGKYYPDSFYSDILEKREERFNQFKTLLLNKNKAEDYCARLANSDFVLAYLDVFNEMVNSIEHILPGSDTEKQRLVIELVEYVENKISENKQIINEIQEKLSNGFDYKTFESLFNLSFETFTKEFFARLLMIEKTYVDGITEMALFAKEETALRDFCIKQELPEIKDVIQLIYEQYDETSGNKVYFSSDLLGGITVEKSEMLASARKMAKLIEEHCDKIFEESNEKTFMYIKWNKVSTHDFKTYINNKIDDKELRSRVIAVLENKAIRGKDLVFTVDGIIREKGFFRSTSNIEKYDEISLEKKGLKIGTEIYKNKNVKMEALDDMIQELAELAEKLNSSGKNNKQSIMIGTEYMIETEKDREEIVGEKKKIKNLFF